MTRTAAQMRAAKAKGASAEQAVVDWFRTHGRPHVERRRLTGTADKGDLAGIPGCVIEVKNEARIDLPGYLRELAVEMANANADTGVVIVKRRGSTDVGGWYAVLTVEAWQALMVEAER